MGNFRKIIIFFAAALLFAGCGGKKETASSMRLVRTEGTVGVSDEKGASVSLMENLSLYGGYHMGTEEESHAWIDLDSVKLAKMDEESEIEIQKEGKDLEIIVSSGGLFFHVPEPLEDDETLNIRTSTMTAGIRGTCGFVRVPDEWHMEVFILEGTVECTVTDPESGVSKTDSVSGGEKAELVLYSEEASPEPEGEPCAIIKEEFELYEIPFYILEELLSDKELAGKINEASGLQIPADDLPRGYVDMGRQYLEHEASETAFTLSELALEADPELEGAWTLRGTARIFGGETEENFSLSQSDYEKALELSEADPEAWLGLADLKIRQKDYDEALSLLESGLEKTGNDTGITEKIAEIESGTITDSQHRQRRYSSFDAGGSLSWYHEYFYDEEGHQAQVVSYDASGTQTSTGEFLYNENGQRIQEWGWHSETGILTRHTLEYDENGNRIRRNSYGENGELRDYTTSEYDGSGHLIRADRYSPEGALQGYSLYEYDEHGNRTGQSYHNADGTMTQYRVYEFNENGQQVKSTSYNGDRTMTGYTVYEYNAEGKRISE